MQTQSNSVGNKWLVGLASLWLVLSASWLWACQVPVFRYALERWTPERYPVVIVTGEPCSEQEKLKWLGDEAKRLNTLLQIQWKTVDQLDQPEQRAIWQKHGKDAGVVLVYYPQKSELRGRLASVRPLQAGCLSALLTSKSRQEIALRLSEGHSAVWVVLKSGDAEKDAAAVKTIETQLKLDQKWLKLPTPEEMEIKADVLSKVKVKLKLDFSVMSLDRDDVDETFLIDCLLNSESDLRNFSEPIAFPVFGRGLVLYALVGKGIHGDTVRAASTFICGPCSCQVKEQNPGFDLLLEHAWGEAVGGVLISPAIPEGNAKPQLLKIPPGNK